MSSTPQVPVDSAAGSAPVAQEAFHLASQIGRMYAFEWNPATDTVVRTGDAELLGELWGATIVTGDNFLSRVHPEDRERFSTIACGVTAQRPSYELSYRYIHDNGSIIWLHERGSAFFDSDNKLLRVIGITADITKTKAAEETLRDLSGRLLSAQEEERARIARELHDDIGQDLALLLVQIEYAIQICQDQQLLARLKENLSCLRRTGAKVRQLSHQLHASELDYIGLGPAVEMLCREVSQHASFRLTCVCKNIPDSLDRLTALSLYRIVQESLQNAAKHAHAKNVSVGLHRQGDTITLTVADDGRGFDTATVNRSGLGILSMQERMNLVFGTLRVQSHRAAARPLKRKCPAFRVTEFHANRGSPDRIQSTGC